MALIAPIAVLAAALAALWLTPPANPILGLSHAAFASAAAGVALVVWMLVGGGVVQMIRSLVSAFVWAALLIGLWIGYDHRDRIADLLQESFASLSDPEPSVGVGGEVTIRRSLGGEFLVAAKVNDKPVKFVFDTGASTVVLTAEDARRVGLDAGRLEFSAEVQTANGATLAAPTRLSRVAVGPIVVRNVRALVTRPGAMAESLLGMSFLDELESFGVEKGRLTFRGKKG